MTRGRREPVLLTPGPVGVADEVLSELAQPGIFHRSVAFQQLFRWNVTALAHVFGSSPRHECLVFTGSGSLANEAVLSSAFTPSDKVLVVSNGEFGERLVTLLKNHSVPTLHQRLAHFEPIRPSLVLRASNAEHVTGVALVAMETSTGMRNPVAEVGTALRDIVPCPPAFFVDAVSALGCESLHMESAGISYCTSVLNKALEGPPGISMACVDTTRLPRRPRGGYLDLWAYLEFAKRDQTPTTPAVPQFRAMLAALSRLRAETVSGRRERYLKLSSELRFSLQRLDFLPVIEDEELRSCAVTAYALPEQVDVELLGQYLLENGFVAWFPPEAFHRGRRLMMLSVMGTVTANEVTQFVDLVSSFVSKAK